MVFELIFFPSFELLLLVLLKVSRALNSIYCSSLLLSPVSVSSVLLPAVSGAASLFDNLHQQHPWLHLRPWWRESSQITKQCMCLVNDELVCMSTGPDLRALISNSACFHWLSVAFRWPLPFPASLFKKKMPMLYVDQLQAAAATLWNCSRDFGICSDDMKNSTLSTKSLLTKQI